MHDSLTSKIFQTLGQKHTEVLGIAVNIHSLGFFGVERRQASPFSSLTLKNTLKVCTFPNAFYALISL